MINESGFEQRVVEEHPELWGDGNCSSGDIFPRAWATLRIDMRLMTPEQQEAVWQASALLRQAGLWFDTGFGCGQRDWELDWSLSGAFLAVKPIYCMNHGNHPGRHTSFSPVYWTTYAVPTGRCFNYAYCSEICRRADTDERAVIGWKAILTGVGVALVEPPV